MSATRQSDEADRFGPIASQEQWSAEGWAEEGNPASGPAKLTSIVSLRLDYATAQKYRKAARTIGKTLSEFLRQGGDELANRVEKGRDQPPIRVTNFQLISEASVKTAAASSAQTNTIEQSLTGGARDRGLTART